MRDFITFSHIFYPISNQNSKKVYFWYTLIPVSLVCPFLPILSVEIFSILGEIGDKSVENFSQNLSLADIGRKF